MLQIVKVKVTNFILCLAAGLCEMKYCGMLRYDSNLCVLRKLISWDMILDINPTFQLGSWAVPALERKSRPQTWPVRRGRCRNKACDANKEEHDECGPNEKPLAVHPNT